MPLVNEDSALFGSESGEGEHADLVHDMIPVSGHLEVIKLRFKSLSHIGDSLRDHLEFSFPLGEVLRVAQNLGSDSSTVQRRRRVSSSGDDLGLRKHDFRGFLVETVEVDSASSLSV